MYKINEVAKLANISTRTLRYYDEISLLVPSTKNESNYRIYTQKDINTLQQILFYKRLGFKLNEIKKLLNQPKFNHLEALLSHKSALLDEKALLDSLLSTIDKTIKDIKGEINMKDKDKFTGFKETIIKENEDKYGKEIRDLYGDDYIEGSYQKIRKM